jgi:hypothetical protein
LTSTNQDETVFQTGIAITLAKAPSSQSYIGAFTAVPEGFPGAIPTDKPSIGISLGGGHLKATQTTAAMSGIHVASQHPESTESINGGLLAFAPKAFPGQLRLRFMNRDGSDTTAVDASHPNGIQNTEIGTKAEDYAENVWLQIEAFNPFIPTEIQDTNAPIGIVEYPNPNYTPETSAFYDGQNGSTLLDATGKIGGGAHGSYTAMVHGRAQIQLSAVADARVVASTGKRDPELPYDGLRGAQLQPIPAALFDPRAPRLGDFLWVSHWVDERSYGRRRANLGESWTVPEAWNGVRDWLEKKVWDLYSDFPTSNGDLLTAIGRVGTITETMSDTVAGSVETTVGSPSATTADERWTLWSGGIRYPLENPSNLDESGLQVTIGVDPVPIIGIHEARHAWQFTLRTVDGYRDDDADYLVAAPPPSAPTLLDARFSIALGDGGNSEFDLMGENCIDTDVHAPFEVDAIRFSEGVVGGPVSCAAPYDLSFSLNGGVLDADIAFTGRTVDDLATVWVAYEGATVIFEILSGNYTLVETPTPFCPSRRVLVSKAVARAVYQGDGSAVARASVAPPSAPTVPTATTVRATLVVPPECGNAASVSKTVTVMPP